jgi:multidrug resistance efflux pump
LKATVKANEVALEILKLSDPQPLVDRARADVDAKEAQRDLAHQAVVECDLCAPSDGEVLRLFAVPGDVLSSQPRQPAVQFCPNLPRIIRAESIQEFAGKIQKGQLAFVEDDTRSAVVQWKGKVERVGDWFGPRRSVILEPFQSNDQRSLECIISLEPGGPPLRIGQRVRVTIKQGGP